MTRSLLRFAALIALSGGSTHSIAQDVITEWNQELLESIRLENTAPPAAGRAMAMVHVAAFEAVNSIDRNYRPYTTYYDCPEGTNKQAAAAVASRNTLASLFPARTAVFDARLAAQLAAIPDGAGKLDGISLGNSAASGLLASRLNDGSSNPAPFVPDGTLPGQWRRTAPAFADPALPQWRNVRPFTVASATQFAIAPVPALDSAAYTAAYNEVRDLGSATSATRTAYDTDTAFLWRAGGNTVTPPGQWNQAAQQISVSRGLTIEENARMFALLGIAEADAGITCWEGKYSSMFWRPITGIREGDADTNGDTVGDAAWTPLFATPNHPSYASGHSTFSSAAATILAQFLGGDAATFTITGDGRSREYTSLNAAMEDAGMSRIFGGIHWQFDNQEGLACGTAIGTYVFANALTVPAPSVAMAFVALGVGFGRRVRRR